MNNLKQIGLAATMYAQDNNDTYFNLGSGDMPNYGHWFKTPTRRSSSLRTILYAYWALGYLEYFAKNRFALPLSERCPC